MTQEEKQLLLRDLSARLPYRVVVSFKNSDTREAFNQILDYTLIHMVEYIDITKIFRDSNGFIVNINHGIDDDAFTYYDECEKACDIAIKYCLENLV